VEFRTDLGSAAGIGKISFAGSPEWTAFAQRNSARMQKLNALSHPESLRILRSAMPSLRKQS
jgi:hypothetical protein